MLFVQGFQSNVFFYVRLRVYYVVVAVVFVEFVCCVLCEVFLFVEVDVLGSFWVVIIDEVLARKFWLDGDVFG